MSFIFGQASKHQDRRNSNANERKQSLVRRRSTVNSEAGDISMISAHAEKAQNQKLIQEKSHRKTLVDEDIMIDLKGVSRLHPDPFGVNPNIELYIGMLTSGFLIVICLIVSAVVWIYSALFDYMNFFSYFSFFFNYL